MLVKQESELRRMARRRIAAGEQLPGLVVRLVREQGRGERCSGCNEPVRADEVEIEAADPQGRRTYSFHVRCHRLWQLESPVLSEPTDGASAAAIPVHPDQQRAFEASEERFRAAIDAVRGVLWTNSPEGEMLGEQPGWTALTGQSLQEYQGFGWSKAVHPEDAKPTVDAWLQAVRERRPFVFEHRVRRHDGMWRRFAIRAIPILASDGAIREWVGVHTDITEQREAEEALRESDRRKDEFLAMLAHEMRNPLATLRNGGELLARALSGDPRLEGAVGMMQRQTFQLTRIVDDLLDVSRISQGQVELRRENIELVGVVNQALEAVGALLRDRQHQVLITASYRPLYVQGDAARLVQCISNVLTNAAKYTDPGGLIRVQVRDEGTEAVIEITDNGVGISKELLPQVFDLFVQSKRTLDRAQGGLGIGLAIVKRLVEMHGGRITAASGGLGEGATFQIRLPQSEHSATHPSRVDPLKAPPRRVLIVDDNRDAADSLAMVLQLDGHETAPAYTAREALELVVTFRPDVVLLDIGLPDMDGYEVARRLRITEQQPVLLVALTGYGQSEDRRRARAAGFDAHVVKPVDFTELAKVLNQTQSGDAPARG